MYAQTARVHKVEMAAFGERLASLTVTLSKSCRAFDKDAEIRPKLDSLKVILDEAGVTLQVRYTARLPRASVFCVRGSFFKQFISRLRDCAEVQQARLSGPRAVWRQ